MKSILLVIGFCLNHIIILGQIRSSQFYSTPLLYNPAATGRFNKNYRLGLMFRNEINAEKKDFKQSALSFDTKVLLSKIPENDCLALGIVGLTESGISEGIKNSYLSFSIGYQKALDEEGKQQIGIGFQNTLTRKTVTKPEFTFESNLLTLLNFGYTNIDIFQFQNVDFSFNDINVGLIFQGTITDKDFYSVGVSVQHITAPEIPFTGGVYILPRQFFSHASFQKEFDGTKKIYTSFLIGVSNQKVNNLISGITYDVGFSKHRSLLLGGWFRKSIINGNSVIPSLGLSFNEFVISFSYDISVSSVIKQVGSSEATFKYTFAKTRNKFLENKFILF